MPNEIPNDDVTLASTTESQAELDHAVSPDWRKPFTPPAKDAPPKPGETPKGATETAAGSGPAKVQSKEGERTDDDGPISKAAQKRIDQLTARAKAAEEKLAKQSSQPQRTEQPKPAGDPEPQEKDFKEWKDYNRALTAWTIREENRRSAAAQREADQQQHTRTVLETYSERVTAYRAENPNFDEETAVNTPWAPDNARDVQASIAFRLAILEADNGPAVLHHLAKNPEEFAKFGGLSPVQVGIRVGRISAALSPSESDAPAPKPAISRAPAPITPVKGSHTAPTALKDMSTDDFIRRREDDLRKNRRRY